MLAMVYCFIPAEPYHSEFHCVAAWGPEKMNLAFGTLGETFHHLLLYYAAPTDRPHFYVAVSENTPNPNWTLPHSYA